MKHAVGALLVMALAAGQARAQAQEGNSSALAEQLFNQGRDLVKANQWAEACPKFEASLRYDPVLGTRLNLATCYEHIGKLASAWGLYRESGELAKKVGDTKRADYAQKQAAALEPRLPKLAISAPANPPAGFVVKRDETTVDAGALGVALYVDPGTHQITASAPGFETFSVTVTVTEGKTETLAVPNLAARPAAAVAPGAEKPPVQPAEPEPAPRGSIARSRKLLGFGIGGAGVVAVGVSLVFGSQASSKKSDAEKLCGSDLACTDMAAFNQAKQDVSDAKSKATVSTVLFGVGLAAIAGGVVVLITAPREPERATAHLVPVVHDGGAGLALTGVF
ncbi:MAG TPA: PEGA domain-containing protein [Kofleriaceae bacterium]|nr:PEGA domain-containing protein [Kofleriaceae bacterium]